VCAENDWTSEQVRRFPDRLRGFCGFNPLCDYALRALARCARDPQLRYGIKLHFGNSDVDLNNPEHVERTRQVFREANRRRMAIVVHMRPSVTRKRPYGAQGGAHIPEDDYCLLLAAVYTVLVPLHWGESPGGFSTLTAVSQLFSNPWMLLAGWIHYLAFDLFIGAWEVRDSAQHGIPHLLVIPCQ
jgi:predicted TIM-barrel fold metal-dependent hydrolase